MFFVRDRDQLVAAEQASRLTGETCVMVSKSRDGASPFIAYLSQLEEVTANAPLSKK